MSKWTEQALENHKKGMNCAQAVACVFAKELGVDENVLFQMAEGFGAGMGGMQCTCGAVSGAVLLNGVKNSSANANVTNTKAGTYKLSKEIVRQFQEKNGSVICKELKGIETGKVLRSCNDCITDAVEIAQKVLGLGQDE